MPSSEDLNKLERQLAGVLTELDQLQLPTVAVHVDLALRRLEDVIAASATAFSSGTTQEKS